MLRSVLLGALVTAFMECGTTYLDSFTCINPDIPHRDASGMAQVHYTKVRSDFSPSR